jgi:AcrR family transcriptional regulator
MPRRTREETTTEIVDRAAALFARQGFAVTSLQQVADEVGYSKAGLLHHFASKQAIHDAVIDVVRRELLALLATADAAPAGRERDLAVITAAVDLTFARPGVSTFVNALVDSGASTDPALVELGLVALRAFGIDPESVDEERTIRLVVACAGLTAAALVAVELGRTREWRATVIDAGMRALGHDGPTP